MTLWQEGKAKPKRMKDILQELTILIQTKRQEGYRPVLMMDANGDYIWPKGDQDLRDFITNTGLVDHYKEKFLAPIRTFVRGSKRIDYILVDQGLVNAIEKIGYLELHKGAYSDHVYVYEYVNFTKKNCSKDLYTAQYWYNHVSLCYPRPIKR